MPEQSRRPSKARLTVETYPQGHCVPSARELIEPITEHIIERVQLLKLKQS